MVLGAGTRSVDAVFVAGRPRKWEGRLLVEDADRLRSDVIESRDRLLEAIEHELDISA